MASPTPTLATSQERATNGVTAEDTEGSQAHRGAAPTPRAPRRWKRPHPAEGRPASGDNIRQPAGDRRGLLGSPRRTRASWQCTLTSSLVGVLVATDRYTANKEAPRQTRKPSSLSPINLVIPKAFSRKVCDLCKSTSAPAADSSSSPRSFFSLPPPSPLYHQGKSQPPSPTTSLGKSTAIPDHLPRAVNLHPRPPPSSTQAGFIMTLIGG